MNTPFALRPLVSRLLQSEQEVCPHRLVLDGKEPQTSGFKDLEIAMKTTLFALLFVSTTAALGQSGSALSNEPQPIQISGHQQHASQRFMQSEQTLLISSDNAYGHGERPLWEVGTKPPAEIPLGDTARLLRSRHSLAKKAVKVLEQ